MPAPSRASAPRRGARAGDAGERALSTARDRSSPAQHLEVAVGDLVERHEPDRGPPLVELAASRSSTAGELLRSVEPDPAVPDELGMPAAAQKGRGKPAGERLDQRVRARVVPARRDVDVLAAEQLGELLRRDRTDDARALEGDRASARRTSARGARRRDARPASAACRPPCADCPTSSSR